MTIEITETTERLLFAGAKRLNLDPQVLANRVLYLMLIKNKGNSQNFIGGLSDDKILNFQND
jgi:hypothetical protein